MGSLPDASWEKVYEVHNLPVRPGRAHIDLLENAKLSTESALGYLYTGRSATPDECGWKCVNASRPLPASSSANGSLYSFVWLMPSVAREELRSACFCIASSRWKLMYHTRAVSGRRLCEAAQTQVPLHTSKCSTQRAIVPESRSHAAIAILVQNSAHSTYGRDSRSTLERCLKKLYTNYVHAPAADVLLFHNGDFEPSDQNAVRRSGQRPRLFFELLAGALWRTPTHLFEHEKELRAAGFSLGYRHMIRWWARIVFERLHVLGYTWVMRLDDDSFIHSRIEYNIFDYMANRGFQYGFRLMSCEPIKHGSYYRLLQHYALANNLTDNWLASHCAQSTVAHFGAPSCGHAVRGVYNNFFVANVSLWMTPKVQAFLDFVDDAGVIYLYNWNDILWHTAIIKLFTPRISVHHFRDFTYEHVTLKPPAFKRIVWGKVHAGTRDPLGPGLVKGWAAEHGVQSHTDALGQLYAGHDNCPATGVEDSL